MIKILRNETPNEIANFIEKVFEIYEVRARVGQENGIIFLVHSNEQNHGLPHIHARFNQYEVSISILSGEILAGNIPNKNLKIAQKWVLNNQWKLLDDWKNLVISAPTYFNKSNLDNGFQRRN